ncbi:hypothetical protein E4G67_03720 [Candidatus Bathyarchaeota archaeon]|nr:MAG: hypothetical protein E4G67_03720 [Candidatus Bathyarchaeota archaeon]
MNSLLSYLNEYDLLTSQEKAYVANGCGPKFGSLNSVVPDFGGIYTPPCNLHDWIYWSGGPILIKDLGDIKFKNDLQIVNNGLSWWKRFSLSWVPDVYYSMVRWLGGPAYYRAPYRRTRQDLQREMRNASV